MYDPRRAILTIAGTPVNGFDETRMYETGYNQTTRTKRKTGADGRTFLSTETDSTGYLKIFLNQASESNSFLYNLYLSNSQFEWSITDEASSTTIALSVASVIEIVPPLVRANELETYEWQILAMQYQLAIGGNEPDFVQ